MKSRTRTSEGNIPSASVKLVVAMAVLAVAFAGIVCCTADASDADDGTISVKTWEELRSACGNAGATVKLSDNITDNSDSPAIEIANNLTIDLNGKKIDRQRGEEGKPMGRLFTISNYPDVTISNGTLAGGHEENGGCILIQGGRLTCDNVVFEGNYANGAGGAIYADPSTEDGCGFYMENGGKFLNNTSKGDGGAIGSSGHLRNHIEKVEFEGNKSISGKGGAVYLCGEKPFTMYCTFKNNSAVNGGAFCFEGGWEMTLLEGNRYEGNSASENGGAMAVYDSPMFTMLESIFIGNTAKLDGGAIHSQNTCLQVFSDDIDVKANQFKDNKADKSGGAIRISGQNGMLSSLLSCITFEGNQAGDHGGALYANDGTDIELEDAVFTGNHAAKNGGAILVGEKENSITINGTIKASDNTADGAGPNVYFAADSKFIAGNFLNGDGCSIGVVLENQERDFTSGFGDIPSNDPAKTFKSDDPNYYVAADPDTKEAKTFKSGSGGDMSGDNTLLIVGGVIAVLAIIGVAVYAVKFRKL